MFEREFFNYFFFFALFYIIISLFFPLEFQVINGISLSTYNSKAAYPKTIAQAIASSMIGVAYTDVINMVATSTSSSSVVTLLSPASLRKAAESSSTSAISLTYTVNTVSTMSTSALESQLTNSVNSGNFNTLMQSYAVGNDATGLEDATSDSVQITAADSSSSGNDLSTGEIAGIVVGCVVGLALVIAVAYYFLYRDPDSKGLLSQPQINL